MQVASNALLKSQQQLRQTTTTTPAVIHSHQPKSPMEQLREHLPDFGGGGAENLIKLGSSVDSNPAHHDLMVADDDDDDPVESAIEAKDDAPRSPTDFEIVSDTELTQAMDLMKLQQQQRPQQLLRDGFVWQKQLVFRSKFTMHTAFERKDNREPAAVTCLSIAK